MRLIWWGLLSLFLWAIGSAILLGPNVVDPTGVVLPAGTFAQRALVAGGALFIGFVVAFAGYDAEKKGEDRPDE